MTYAVVLASDLLLSILNVILADTYYVFIFSQHVNFL